MAGMFLNQEYTASEVSIIPSRRRRVDRSGFDIDCEVVEQYQPARYRSNYLLIEDVWKDGGADLVMRKQHAALEACSFRDGAIL